MMQNKKIIAVTGGIGSGKSTVCNILREWGYAVFSCDEIYSELLEDKLFLKKIEESFGNVTDTGGKLDRQMLSQKVFEDSNARKQLERITHPAIMSELLKRAKEVQADKVFCEVPLLFENGFEILFDGVIAVVRDEKLRIEGVKKRSNLTESQIKERISAQFDYSRIATKNCKIAENNGNIANLQSTMRDIINSF